MLTELGVKIVQLVTDDPDAARCPVCRARVDLGQGLGADPPARPARAAGVRGSAVAQAAMAVPHRRVPAADVHRAGRAGAGRDAHDDPAAGGARGGGRGRPRSVRGRGGAPGVVADGATRGGGPRRGRAASSRSRRRCSAWTRPGSGGRDGCPTGTTTTAGSGGSARIRGRPGSSTSPVTRRCWGRSTAGPAPRSRPGWPPARPEFRAGVEVVVIDPHAGYAAAVRAALPDAAIAVDHFHLILLANKAVTAVRQRVTRDLLGRRGRADRPDLGEPAVVAARPGTPVRAGVGADVERLHRPRPDRARSCRRGSRRRNSARCARPRPAAGTARTSGDGCARSTAGAPTRDIPELTTLAETIETWWPAIEVFLTTGLTNARTEGTNRLIKQVKRAACGFRNRDNYRRRVRLHCTRRTRRLSARNRRCPPKIEEPL